MVPALRHRALYAAFDRFPSRKGSAVHTDRFARTLFDHAGGGMLYVLGGNGLPPYQLESPIEIVRYSREAEHLLERATGFGARLSELLERLAPTLRLAHFRDPWGGLPIVEPDERPYTTVYEVNGLPSIELPFLYPAMPPSLLRQIAAFEQRCLDRADAVITPSALTAQRLLDRGVETNVFTSSRTAPTFRPRRRHRRPTPPPATSCTSARSRPGRASTRRCGRSRG